MAKEQIRENLQQWDIVELSEFIDSMYRYESKKDEFLDVTWWAIAASELSQRVLEEASGLTKGDRL